MRRDNMPIRWKSRIVPLAIAFAVALTPALGARAATAFEVSSPDVRVIDDANTTPPAAEAVVPSESPNPTESPNPPESTDSPESATPDAPMPNESDPEADPSETDPFARPNGSEESSSAPEPFARAATLTCEPDSFYSIQGGGSLRSVTGGTVTSVGVDFGSGNYWNGLGIAGNGVVWAIQRSGDQDNNSRTATIYRYNPATGTVTRVVPNSFETSGNNIAGAVNLHTGDYYFGGWRTLGWGNNTTRTFYLYKVAAGASQVTTVGWFNDISTAGSANGDMAFDANGNLYVVRSGTSTVIFTVTQATLAGANGNQLQRTATEPQSGNNMLTNVNGIAFRSDGNIVLGNDTSAAAYNPTTWSRIGNSNITTQLGQSTDLASCTSPATFTLKKDISGRKYDADQFKLTLATASETTISTTTTTADPASLQLGPIPIVTGNDYLAFEDMAIGSTSQLSDYEQEYSCTRNGQTFTRFEVINARIVLHVTLDDSGASFECTIKNTPINADLTVQKQWIVDGVTYANGSQPSGMSATASMTMPNGTMSAATWGQKYLRYGWNNATGQFQSPVQLSETVALTGDRALCRVDNSSVTSVNGVAQAIAIPQTGNATVPAELLNKTDSVITVTNTVNCKSEFHLAKTVIGDGSDWAFGFTLTGPSGGQPIPLTNANASSGALPITHGVQYTLAEDATAATWLRGVPVCLVKNQNNSPVPDENAAAPGFQFTAKPGQQISCTVENSTAKLTLVKEVTGNLEPGDFTLTADPDGSGLTPITGPGSSTAAAAPSGFVLPDHGYVVSEAGSSPYITDGQLQLCTLPLAGGALTDAQLADCEWVAASSATISAAAGAHVIVKFVNEEPYGPQLPMAGGTGNWPYVLGGGGLLALTALVGYLWYRRSTRAAA